VDEYPGHAAWIDGDWKLHCITNKQGKVSWELYNLAVDPLEKNDVINAQSQRAARMREKLDTWLESVVRSLNGEDYSR
jgi:hypothetical protein